MKGHFKKSLIKTASVPWSGARAMEPREWYLSGMRVVLAFQFIMLDLPQHFPLVIRDTKQRVIDNA